MELRPGADAGGSLSRQEARLKELPGVVPSKNVLARVVQAGLHTPDPACSGLGTEFVE